MEKKREEKYNSKTTELETDELSLKMITRWLIEMLNLKRKIIKIIIQM